MSRYYALSKDLVDSNYTVTYGWDNKLSTYFLEVKDTEGKSIYSLGNESPITDLKSFIRLSKRYCRIPALIKVGLVKDKEKQLK